MIIGKFEWWFKQCDERNLNRDTRSLSSSPTRAWRISTVATAKSKPKITFTAGLYPFESANGRLAI
jgi:G:T-mismatch repair DNA endonuclease (very short patch repair protein)